MFIVSNKIVLVLHQLFTHLQSSECCTYTVESSISCLFIPGLVLLVVGLLVVGFILPIFLADERLPVLAGGIFVFPVLAGGIFVFLTPGAVVFVISRRIRLLLVSF